MIKRDGLPNDYIRCVFMDRAGTLWIGTNGDGLAQIGSKITSFTTRNGLPDNRIWSITQDSTVRSGSAPVAVGSAAFATASFPTLQMSKAFPAKTFGAFWKIAKAVFGLVVPAAA